MRSRAGVGVARRALALAFLGGMVVVVFFGGVVRGGGGSGIDVRLLDGDALDLVLRGFVWTMG